MAIALDGSALGEEEMIMGMKTPIIQVPGALLREQGRCSSNAHFTDEKTEAKEKEVICLRLHGLSVSKVEPR